MRKLIRMFFVLAMMLCMGTSAFAEAQDISNVIGEGIIKINSGETAIEPRVGRHYQVSEEVVADRKLNEYVYPIGQSSSKALKRAYVYSEKHYEVYRRRVGNSTYKAFLYDEYHTTWKGQWRLTKDSAWQDAPGYEKSSQISRERSPVVEMLGILS